MIGSTGGDFIFQMLPDQSELNESTQQYDKASSDLLQQIAELRAQLAAMESKLNEKGNNNSMSGARNENLQQEDSVLSIGELNSLGLKAYRQKNYNEALANFRKAIAIDSSDVQPINNLGFVYYKMGNFHESLVWIQKAIELAPGRTVAYLNLADVELALGEKEKAIANYEKYLSMAKENNFTKEITEKVNSLKKE
jgi:tetratricopeptide (TPR) repeat protein